MFRDVSECSGMFHVPAFIDDRLLYGKQEKFNLFDVILDSQICQVSSSSWHFFLSGYLKLS